jgi:SAM-dependent methyltransferase
MAHKEQIDFCLKVKNNNPKYFKNIKVLDCGSLDINGCNRYLFTNCEYTGIDLGKGKNVDIVSKIHEFKGEDNSYDTIISTECFEHDMYYKESILNIYRMLKSGGLFIFTCATKNRPEHGTKRTSKIDSPFTSNIEEWSDYYKNLDEKDIREVINLDNKFKSYYIESVRGDNDLNFYGIKI